MTTSTTARNATTEWFLIRRKSTEVTSGKKIDASETQEVAAGAQSGICIRTAYVAEILATVVTAGVTGTETVVEIETGTEIGIATDGDTIDIDLGDCRGVWYTQGLVSLSFIALCLSRRSTIFSYIDQVVAPPMMSGRLSFAPRG